MSKSNVELSNIIPFTDDGRWYLKLIYTYEDKKGKHTVVIPKAAVPFTQGSLPSISCLDPYYRVLSEHPYINCNDSMRDYYEVFAKWVGKYEYQQKRKEKK